MKKKEYLISFNNTVFPLEEIIQNYSRYVYSVIYQIGKTQLTLEDTEEILSEVFLKLWIHKRDIVEFTTIKPYLGIIAKNCSIDYLRKNKIECVEYNDEIQNIKMTQKIYEVEYLEFLEKAFKNLSPLDKKIMKKNLLDDRSIRDISLDMGLKENTVRMKIYRNKKKIAKYLLQIGALYE